MKTTSSNIPSAKSRRILKRRGKDLLKISIAMCREWPYAVEQARKPNQINKKFDISSIQKMGRPNKYRANIPVDTIINRIPNRLAPRVLSHQRRYGCIFLMTGCTSLDHRGLRKGAHASPF
jgi:hypothetical protein